MAVTSSTIGGVNTWTFSGVVTDAQIQTAWAALVTNGVYIINRAIYLDNTADISGVTGGFLVDFGTQVNPAFILHTSRDKTKSTFKNFTFIMRTGLSVPNRGNLISTWNGTVFTAPSANGDGLSQDGGGFVYGVQGNPGGADPRFLLELPFDNLSNVTIYSQEFTEQELQILVNQSKVLKGLIFEKCYGFPQISTPNASTGVVVYRSNMNTQGLSGGGLIPIRLLPVPAGSGRYASVCYVDSYLTRNNADINTRLIDTFSSSATNRAHISILNNYTRETWFGASKTAFPPPSNWVATNTIYGGVLRKLQFVGGGNAVIRAYDSRSTTVAQPCKFEETGFVDFLNTNLAPTTDVDGKFQIVHIGAIATGSTAAITRFTNQRYTYQKFGQRVSVTNIDMTAGGDNDLSAFTPIIPITQTGITRTQAAINSATSINNFQELLEELHVLAIGLSGEQSYNGAFNGNLFNYDGTTLTTSFATVNVDATATNKIAYNATTNTLTIKSSVLADTSAVQRWNNASGTINRLNGAVIQGVYQDIAGLSTIWEFQSIEANTSLAVYNSTGTILYYNAVTAPGNYRYYIAPGTTGTYTYAIEKYGKKREEGNFPANNGGIIFYAPRYNEDPGITELTLATVAAYTSIGDLDKFYDYTAFYRLSQLGINKGDITVRAGTAIDIAPRSLLVHQNPPGGAVLSVVGNTITIKSALLENGFKYTLITSSGTVTANTNEIISADIEDANGDSSVNILGSSGDFTLWKLANAVSPDDFATGVNLGNVSNEKVRFISDPGFKIVVRDNVTSFRQVIPMDKGVYEAGMFFGSQIQLAQANDIPVILAKVEQSIIEHQIINEGVRKASKLIPHNTII